MSQAADRVRLEESWKQALLPDFEADYMQQLRAFLGERRAAGVQIYPPGPEIFAALDRTPLSDVRVVIIGQDPYHGPGQAHGLCFSVRPGVDIPPSLRNIFQEIESDLGEGGERRLGRSGSLDGWARQGVLLLNAVLTVERGRAGAHQGKGWERFTDRIVELIARERENVVFMLWGSYAQKKGAQVDRSRHCVLASPHPSPLSAHRGFFGSRHFSAANRYLVDHGQKPVNWFETN